MAQPSPPIAPVLPPIRTMADDLASAKRGEFARGAGLAFPYAPPPSPPSGIRRPSVPPLALPPQPPTPPRRRRRTVLGVVVGLLVVAILAVAGVVGSRLRPSGTVADAVPAEAIGFASVRTSGGGSGELLSPLLAPFPGLTAEQLAGATDVTYLLLPGPSPASPVPALLIRGLPTVDLAAAPNLSLVPGPRGLLIVEAVHRGRLDGIGQRVFGREREFRGLLKGLGDTPILLALRGRAVGALLQLFAPHPLPEQESMVLAVTPEAEGAATPGSFGTARVRLRTAGSAPAAAGDGGNLASSLPGSVILAATRPNAAADLARLTSGDAFPESLSPLLRTLREQGEPLGALRDAARGPWAFGVLPTSVPGVRDAVAVIPLKEGADVLPALRTLEGALRHFGPYLTGSEYPDAAFTETVYEGVTLRYVSFGAPARAFDYAVIGDQLLLATSREAMHALVDTIGGRRDALESQPTFALLASGAVGKTWLSLRADAALRAEVPPALGVLADLLPSLLLVPEGPGELTGWAMLASAAPASLPGVGAEESAVSPVPSPPAGSPVAPASPAPEPEATDLNGEAGVPASEGDLNTDLESLTNELPGL